MPYCPLVSFFSNSAPWLPSRKTRLWQMVLASGQDGGALRFKKLRVPGMDGNGRYMVYIFLYICIYICIFIYIYLHILCIYKDMWGLCSIYIHIL